MSDWKIDPQGLTSLLQNMAEQYQLFAEWKIEDEANSAVSALAWGGEVTAQVPDKVGFLLQMLGNNELKKIVSRIQASIVGVGNAARSYQLGQEEMANAFEREMLKSALTGDFKYFEEHGYKGE